MADRFGGLLHHAVIGGDDQNDDVGGVGAACAHFRKSLVAGGIDKGDLRAGSQRDAIRADMLGDAARFARHDVGQAQSVQKRGLAVIDMAHDGDHRGTRNKILLLVFAALKADFDVSFGDALDLVAEFLNDQLGRVGVDALGDGGHDAKFHQRFDDIGAAFRHTVGQFLHRDGFRHDDFAHHFFGLGALRHHALFFFAGALERRDRTHPLDAVFAFSHNFGQGQLAGALLAQLVALIANSQGFLRLDDAFALCRLVVRGNAESEAFLRHCDFGLICGAFFRFGFGFAALFVFSAHCGFGFFLLLRFQFRLLAQIFFFEAFANGSVRARTGGA